MLMGFLFKSQSISYGQAFLYIGGIVAATGLLLFLVNFSKTAVAQPAETELQTA